MRIAVERVLSVLAQGAVGERRVGFAVHGAAAFVVHACAERSLSVLARGEVGEGRVGFAVHRTAAFAVGGASERGLAVLARGAAGDWFAVAGKKREPLLVRGTALKIGLPSRVKRGGIRECCRPRWAYEFRGLRGGFLRMFSHGR